MLAVTWEFGIKLIPREIVVMLQGYYRIGILMLTLLFFLNSCATTGSKNHIIMIDKKGNLLYPNVEDHSKVCNEGVYFQEIVDKINKSGKKMILIFIHGGLNGEEDGIKNAEDLAQEIENAGYYPLFITWNSGLMSSYWDHLTLIRQGEEWKNFGFITAPFYLLSDALSGIASYPTLIVQQLETGPSKGTFRKGLIVENAEKIEASINKHNADINKSNADWGLEFPNPPLQAGEDKRGFLNRYIFSPLLFITTAPVKLISSPFVGVLGKNSWRIMERRVTLLFRRSNELDIRDRNNEESSAMLYCKDKDFETIPECLENQTPSGALSRFLLYLNYKVNTDSHEVTLIAHSMGAIVANQMLINSPEIKYKNIVYMGAASSISDFESSVIPYMQKHKETNFFNLMLHPYAESGEINYLDIPPRGSLLEWLDNYYTEPRTLLDRRMGKYLNIMQVMHTIDPKVRDRIYLRYFDVSSDSKYPQSHGEFNNRSFNFWSSKFWFEGKIK